MMHQTLFALKSELKKYVNELYKTYKDSISEYADVVLYQITDKLLEYKSHFESIEYPSKSDEIYYFKHIKTKLLAIIHLCYYIKSIETNKPAIKQSKLKKYYLKELVKAKKEIQQLDYYYSYFRAKSTILDEKLFLRTEKDTFRNISNVILEIDCKTNTPYIYLFSRAKALYYLKQFLKAKIARNPQIESTSKTIKKLLHWTASKADLTELIYALYASGVFNNGKATIKEIVDTMQDTFQVDIGNHTRTFYDIKLRKKLKTKYIDQLKESLMKKINDTDYKLFIE